MNQKFMKQMFLTLFNDFSKKHIFAHNFYNLSQEEKYEIAKDTFNDIANHLKANITDTMKDNIILNFMELL